MIIKATTYYFTIRSYLCPFYCCFPQSGYPYLNIFAGRQNDDTENSSEAQTLAAERIAELERQLQEATNKIENVILVLYSNSFIRKCILYVVLYDIFVILFLRFDFIIVLK